MVRTPAANHVSEPPLTEGAVGAVTSTRQVAVRVTVRVPRTWTVNVCRPGFTVRYEIEVRQARQRLRSSLHRVLVIFPVRFHAKAAAVARVTAAGLGGDRDVGRGRSVGDAGLDRGGRRQRSKRRQQDTRGEGTTPGGTVVGEHRQPRGGSC